MKKFIEKNQKQIAEIKQIVEANREGIALIITSFEVFYGLPECMGEQDVQVIGDGEFFKYKGIRVISDSYLPAGSFHFVYKDNKIEFNMPCNCGKYDDE